MGSIADMTRVVFELPMTVRFRGLTRRRGLLLRGVHGWAEFSPFEEYDDAEASWWLRAALETADVGPPAPVRHRVPVNCTVPALGPAAAAEVVRTSHGCTTAKVKVAEPGQSFGDDVARVGAVRDALGSEGRIRVDANGAWTVGEAVRAIGGLAEFGLEYVEQPCRTLDELRAVRGRVDVPIAADESIRKAADPLLVRDRAAADIAVLKVQPLGGPRRCLELAEQLDLPVVVSSALESSVGLAAGIALAAALPELPFACGLATGAMLSRDVVQRPFTVDDGHLDVRRPEVDPDALDAVRLRGADETAWQDRLARCGALLQDQRR